MINKSVLSLLILALGTASAVSVVEIQPPTKEEIAAIKKKQNRGGGPLQFAQPVPVSIDPSTHGTWDVDAKTWTLQVISTGAKNLNFGFTRFDPPQGTTMTIRPTSKDSNAPVVKTVETDYKATKQFWSPILETDDVIITVKYGTKTPMPNPPQDVLLGSINVGFRQLGKNLDKSGSCNIDVVCPLGIGWESEIQSVAGIAFSGSLFCTGAMINNMRQDGTP